MSIQNKVLERLQKVRSAGRSKWTALCPSHEDSTPSLSVAIGDEDRLLIHCYGGCNPDDVLSAMGLSWDDLFPEGRNQKHRESLVAHLRKPYKATHSDYLVAIGQTQIKKGVRLSADDKMSLKKALLHKAAS